MKNFVLSVAGLGVGGAAWYGIDSPDFDRTINRPPAAVYAAFSELSEEGTFAAPEDEDLGRTVSIRTVKAQGEAINYEILVDDRPVVTAELTFSPAGEGGSATRMTAEFDIDAFELGSAFETEAGVALSMVPDAYFDRQFAAFMSDLADDIEAGRPLPPLEGNRLGVRERGSAGAQPSRGAMMRDQRAAARPMTDARPMVDPEAAAEAYRRGQPNPNGNWGQYAAAPRLQRADRAGEGEAVEHLEEARRLAVLEMPDVDLRGVDFRAGLAIPPGAAADHRHVVAVGDELVGVEIDHLPVAGERREIFAGLLLARLEAGEVARHLGSQYRAHLDLFVEQFEHLVGRRALGLVPARVEFFEHGGVRIGVRGHFRLPKTRRIARNSRSGRAREPLLR